MRAAFGVRLAKALLVMISVGSRQAPNSKSPAR
jgi:hypothetical protein